ncbi:MAG: M81 family metallopeptidase [Oscillospiraceae bacterium]|nr:M81 family metallopeptidase [Oscillospiraceae bacterium]
MKKKILTVQFRHETNTFAPKPADMQAFRCNRFFVGEEVFPNVRKMRTELTACLDLFDTREDVELVPTVALYATPCGPVTEEVYDFVTRQILTVIRKEGPFAGVFLDIHGAMVAEGHPDGEGDLMELLRRELGWEIPIVASLDLHANVTEKMARCASALFPYNTYPHVDMYETGMAVAKLLEKTLDGKMQPAMAYRRIPFLQPLLSHESEALRPLYELAEKLSQTPGVVSVRFAHGFFPADIEEMGMSVMVITEGNASLAEKTADTLADAIRERIPLLTAEYMDLDSALDIALREEGTVTLADASDNPGAGGMGDTTHILKRLLERGITGAAIAIILDPESVKACIAAGEGSLVQLQLGGWSDPVYSGGPLGVTAKVVKLTDGKFLQTGPVQHGVIVDFGDTAVLEIAGNLVLVTSLSRQPFDIEIFYSHGIDPAKQKILVTKSSIHYRATFCKVSKTMIPLALGGYASPIPGNYTYKNWKQ